jgi:hypothetical protein
MEHLIIKLSKPVYLIKKDYKFLFLAERNEKIIKNSEGIIELEHISFLIRYRMISPKLCTLARNHNEYSLVINKKDLTTFLGHKHFDPIEKADIHINPKSIGLGSIIFNHLFYYGKKECSDAIMRGLFLSYADEYSEENRLRRDKLYKNLGFDFKGTGGGESTKKLKLSESKINLDSRGFIIKDVSEEELKKQLMITELEMEKFSNIEVYYPEIKKLYKETEANLGHKHSDKCWQSMLILIVVCMMYLCRGCLDNEGISSDITFLGFCLGGIVGTAFVLSKITKVISATGIFFLEKEYEIPYKKMKEFLSITNLPIEKYLGNRDVIQILDEYHPIGKEQNVDTKKMSCKYEDIFDLTNKVMQEKRLLWSMANKFNKNKIFIEEIKEMYREPFYILARVLRVEDILKRYKGLKETKIK